MPTDTFFFTERQLNRVTEEQQGVHVIEEQKREEERLQVVGALLRLRDVVCKEKLIVPELTIASAPEGKAFRIMANGTFYYEWGECYGVMWDDNSLTYTRKYIPSDVESLRNLPIHISPEQVESIIEQLLR
jgi:hypothetical protein